MLGVRFLHLFVPLLLLLLLPRSSEAQRNGDVKLVGTDTDFRGTVAVYYNGQWGSICDDSWNYRDADVVCRMLGYERSYRIFYRAYYGQAPGPILIDQIRCPNNAKDLMDCTHNGWGVHDCEKREDAGVDCLRKFPRKPANMPIRLSCPECVQWGSCTTCPRKAHPSPTDCSTQATVEGIVFADYNGQWLPVTGEGWDIKDARVVCGELGYPVALPVPSLSEIWTNWNGGFLSGCGGGVGLISGPSYPRCDLLGEGSGALDGLCMQEEIDENDVFRNLLDSALLTKVQCVGNEKRLLDCYFSEFGPHPNPSLSVATVRCGFKPHTNCTRDKSAEIYRTRAGPVPWQGRLEVRVEGKWGTVCDTDFDVTEANIVCRAMGFGSATRVHYRAYYGRGAGPIHYNNLRCNGTERTLEECTSKTTGRIAEGCGHQGDVGVVCNRPIMCDIDDDDKMARLIEIPRRLYSGYVDNFVQVRGPLGWGTLCRSSLNIRAAGVICKSEQELFATQTRFDTFPGGGTRYVGSLECTGDEESLDECEVRLQVTGSCAGQVKGGDVIVDCTTALPDLVPDVTTIENSLKFYPYIDRLPLYFLRCAQNESCLSSSAKGQGPNTLRHLLRFDSLTMNWGRSDFLPNQRRDQWEFHSCHNHFHSFEAFIHYDLLNFTSGAKVAEGHKASFCLEDSTCRGGGRRFSCGTGVQGISPNCGDLYGRYLDCQWIDITDVPLGFYLLRLIVNPDYLVAESDHRNNAVTCAIELQPGAIMKHYWCRLSDQQD